MTDEKHKSIVNSEEGINECILQKNEWFVNGRQNQWNQSLWNGKMPSHPITLCNDLDRKKLAAEKLHLTKSGRNLCRFKSLYLMLVMVYQQPSTTEPPATLTTPYYLQTPWKLKSCLPPNQGKTVLNTIILIFVNYHFTAWSASLKTAHRDKSYWVTLSYLGMMTQHCSHSATSQKVLWIYLLWIPKRISAAKCEYSG